MIQVPRCFKNTDNHKAIEMMLTNSVHSFQNSCAPETGLYDFDKMTGTVLKSCVDICIRALDIYALKKKNYLRVNKSPFMNIAVSKAVLDRTRLRNKILTK